jgi:hypothetical protein
MVMSSLRSLAASRQRSAVSFQLVLGAVSLVRLNDRISIFFLVVEVDRLSKMSRKLTAEG